MKVRLLIFCCVVQVLWSCGSKKVTENDITVFCAASLTPVVEQIKEDWEKIHSQQIIINSASSGTLAKQMENGAPADIFLAASPEWMEYVIKSMELRTQPKTIATNKLAVITPIDTQLDSMDFEQLLREITKQNGMIAIGDPGHVPLGKYTKESMDFYRIYEVLASRFILTNDARSALRLVELGEATMGFVYMSDAIASSKVRIVAMIPAVSHQAIIYQSIVVDDSNPAALDFHDYLSSSAASGTWAGHGFIP